MADDRVKQVKEASDIVTVVGSYLGSAVPSRDIPRYVDLWLDEIETLDKVARRTFGLSDSDSHGNPVVNIAMLAIDPESVRVDQRDA